MLGLFPVPVLIQAKQKPDTHCRCLYGFRTHIIDVRFFGFISALQDRFIQFADLFIKYRDGVNWVGWPCWKLYSGFHNLITNCVEYFA